MYLIIIMKIEVEVDVDVDIDNITTDASTMNSVHACFHQPVDAGVDVGPEHRQEQVDGHWGLKSLHRPLQESNRNSS